MIFGGPAVLPTVAMVSADPMTGLSFGKALVGLLAAVGLVTGLIATATAVGCWARASKRKERLAGSSLLTAAGGCLLSSFALAGLLVVAWMGRAALAGLFLAAGLGAAAVLVGIDLAVRWANRQEEESTQ